MNDKLDLSEIRDPETRFHARLGLWFAGRVRNALSHAYLLAVPIFYGCYVWAREGGAEAFFGAMTLICLLLGVVELVRSFCR